LSPDEKRRVEGERKRLAEVKEREAERQRVRDELARAQKYSQDEYDAQVQKAVLELKLAEKEETLRKVDEESKEKDKKIEELEKVCVCVCVCVCLCVCVCVF
jgi:hypothetical protein